MDHAAYSAPPRRPLSGLSIDVKGMSCASCSARVERALGKLEAVSDAAVNLATGRAELRYDSARISPFEIVEAIRAAGYDPVSAEVELVVEDMSCAACVGRVERALKKAPGVLEASVNLTTERARVTFLPAMSDGQTLAAIVSDAGYRAHPVRDSDAARAEDRDRHQSNLRAMRLDLVVAGGLGLAIMTLAMGGTFSPGFARGLDALSPFCAVLGNGAIRACQRGAVRAGAAVLSPRPDRLSPSCARHEFAGCHRHRRGLGL